MPAGETKCVVCAQIASSHVMSRADPRQGMLDLNRCSSCETVFLAGWSTEFESSLYQYYAQRSERSEAELFSMLNDQRCAEVLAGLEELVGPGRRRLLDVGCGYGQCVRTALGQGWDAQGIDLSAAAIALARRFHLPVQQTDFFERSLTGPYDVITMFEFIEHVPTPLAFVRRAAELLDAGGVLHLTTPNFASIDRRVSGAAWPAINREHITYFTPRTLRGALESSGEMEVLRIETRGVSPSVLLRSMRQRGRGHRDRGGALSASGSAAPDHKNDQRIRRAIERSRMLRAAKGLANRALDLGGLGNTIAAWCRRR